MELTIHVDPVERTVRFREVHALAAGDSCSVVLEGVRGADVAALRLALYRDAASDSPVASCPSFAPVRGHPNLATGDLRLDTAEMAAWFEAVRPEVSATDRDGSGSGDAAERAVRTDGWLVVSEPTRTWAACRVPVVLRPGAGVSGVVDPTSIQSLVEGLVSAAMSEALAAKADKATTLAGYGITDAATKSELDSVNQNAANAIFGVQSELSTKADLVDGKVPAAQLPAFVDDVLEYDAVSAFPTTGEDGKIYVAKDTNKTYRWGGTQYVEIGQSLALGETSETAYPGDKGKATAEKADAAYSAAESLAYGVNSLAGTIGTHIRDTNNPHKVKAAQVGALPLEGGTLTGDLSVGEDHSVARKLIVASDSQGNGITLQGGSSGSGSSVDIGGADSGGGSLNVLGGGYDGATVYIGGSQNAGGKLTVQGGGNSGGIIEVTGAGASIKKNGKEVATEESLAPEYSPSSSYSVGSFVYHDGNIYQCTTAIADGGEAWNAAHWELRKLDDFFTESNSLLNGRLAYSRNTTGLKDRAFNALTFDGTEYNLSTALAAVTPTASGQPRDLLIVATATAATTISFTAGTIKGDKPTIDGSGTWLITLTEYASGVWYCRQIKMEDAA